MISGTDGMNLLRLVTDEDGLNHKKTCFHQHGFKLKDMTEEEEEAKNSRFQMKKLKFLDEKQLLAKSNHFGI